MPEHPFSILVCGTFGDTALERLRGVGGVRLAAGGDEDTLIGEIADADALLVRTQAAVTERVLGAGRRLKVVGRAGVGIENIDVAAAARLGIEVVYTPAAASDTVAEFTFGLILALERHLVVADAAVRGGRFAEARGTLVGRELRGLTLGIVGMGRIGSRVGRMARSGLGMTVVYNDIRPIEDLDYEATAVEKEAVWSQSDVVTLHVPLTDLTRRLVDAAVLERFKPTTTLINTSRGAVVDGAALAKAVSQKRIAGAALDVFDPEPPVVGDALLRTQRVLVTPHIGARTAVGLGRMDDVVEDVIAVLERRRARWSATAELRSEK